MSMRRKLKRLNIIDFYDIVLPLASMWGIVWFIKLLEDNFGPMPHSYKWIFGGSAAIFAMALFVASRPHTWMGRIKTILYGSVAGVVIALGIIGWFGSWPPPVPGL